MAAALDRTLHGEGRPALNRGGEDRYVPVFLGESRLSVSVRQGDLKLYDGWREASGQAFLDFCDADSPTIA
jgi:hypothetical protein